MSSSLLQSTTSATCSQTSRGEAEEERPPRLATEPDQEAEAEVQAAAAAAADSETEEEKARRLLYCSLCKVAVNSASQLEAHNSGKRRVVHRFKLLKSLLIFTVPDMILSY